MQKLITIAIDIEELKERSNGPFTVTEVEGVNAILQEGWTIEDWEFLTNQTEEEKAIVLLVLNEEETEPEFEDSEYSDTDDSDDEEDLEEGISENQEESDEQDQVARTTAQADMSMN